MGTRSAAVGRRRVNVSRREAMGTLGGLAATFGLSESARGKSSDVSVSESESAITLENSLIAVRFSKRTGGIEQITATETGRKFRDPDGPETAQAWALKFYHDQYDDVASKSSWGGNEPNVDVKADETGKTLVLTWTAAIIDSAAAPDGFKREFDGSVGLSVSLEPDDPGLSWDLRIDNDDLQIKAVQAPYVTNVAVGGENGDELVVPTGMGRLVADPASLDREYRVRYPSGFGTMQFTAFTSEAGGFYLQTSDPDGYLKQLVWSPHWGDEDGLDWYHEYDVPLDHSQDVSVPYTVVLEPLAGDWHDAADRYRDWATAAGLLPSETATVPDWYRRLGLSVAATSYRRGTAGPQIGFEETVRKVTQTQAAVDLPMQLLWNGYQKHGKYGYGDWFPPAEGWEAFREAIATLSSADVTTAGFVGSTTLYDRADLFEEHSDTNVWLVRDADGDPVTTETMGFTGYETHFYPDSWQAELQATVRQWAKNGGKQVWLDGFPWGKAPNFPHRTCFAADHDHPRGAGGRWWATRSKTRLQELEAAFGDAGEATMLSGEGVSDFFLPELDVQHARDVVTEFRGDLYPQETVVPLTRYALGDWLQVRGRVTAQLVEGHQSEQFVLLGLARALSWGALPAISLSVQRPADELFDPGQLRYAARVGRMFSVDAPQFLTDGRLLRPPAVESPRSEITVDMGFWDEPDRTIERDTLHVSAWESGDGTQRALLATNIHTDPVTLDVDLQAHPFGGDDDRIATLVRNGEYQILDGSATATLDLEPRDVVLVMTGPETSPRRDALKRIVATQDADGPRAPQEARRALANGDPERALAVLEASDQAAGTTTAPPPSTTEAGRTAAKTADTPSPSRAENESNGSAPGFGVLAAITALSGVILRQLSDGD